MATDPGGPDGRSALPAALAEGTVEAWWVDLEDVPADVWRLDRAILDGAERARAARFVFERDRKAFLAAHVLVRAMLARLLGRPAADWRFVAGPKGKPAVDPAFDPRPVAFNLSHTATAVLCGVTRAPAIGVDVECRERRGNHLAIASAFFAREEVDRLEATPAHGRTARFFAVWTLKEAYVKARGDGLSLPLDGFVVDPEGPSVAFHPGIADDPARWQLSSLTPDHRHTMAIAVERPGRADLAIHLRRVSLPDLAGLAAPAGPLAGPVDADAAHLARSRA